MTEDPDEPAWMVIAPLPIEAVTAVIDGVLVGDTWQLIEGARGHIAITGAFDTCGVEDRLAEDLSLQTDQPVYALVFDEDDPRVDAFVGGAEAGVVAANLYDVAHVLGVGIDARDETETIDIDLTPHPMPGAGPDEPLVLGKTLRQWEHLMAYELNWDLALPGADGAADEVPGDEVPGDEVLPLLDDPAARRVAVKLVGGLGAGAFAGVGDVIAKLSVLAAADPSLADDVDEAIGLLEDDEAAP